MSSTDRAKRAALYRKAAEYCERKNGDFGACWCISTFFGFHGDELTAFREAFGDGRGCGEFWWNFTSEHGARVLALGFMAAMVETGDA